MAYKLNLYRVCKESAIMTELPLIAFNRPAFIGRELDYVRDAISGKEGISGDGYYSKQCQQWFKSQLGCDAALLMGSCTHGLETAALLLELQPGDEIIMPSFTFVTTANAFVLHGGTPVFVDIHPDTMNINEELIEAAITPRTRAIVVVHYAGVACRMERILSIARKHGLVVIEDAAQAIFSTYGGKPLGSFGDMGTFSFHETKNYTSGEGGVLIVNNPAFTKRAEIIRQKGTNREQFFRGEVDKYTWVDIGSSFVMSELNAAYLYAQLEGHRQIDQKRTEIWISYIQGLSQLQQEGKIELPVIPESCSLNAHIFFIKVKDLQERTALLTYLKKHERVHAVFHYVPLHSSPAGRKYARFHGEDRYTTQESERLVRLPLHYHLSEEDLQRVINGVMRFYTVSSC